MQLDDLKIKEILLAGNYVSAEDMKKAEIDSKKNRSSVVSYLLVQEIITEDLVGQAYAESVHVPYFDLNSNMPTREKMVFIPEAVALKRRVVLVSEEGKAIIVASDSPEDKELLKEVTRSPHENES